MKSLKNKFFIAAAVAGLGLSLNSGLYAQNMPTADGHAAAPMEHSKMAEKMQERMSKHRAAIHDKLKLSAAQEPAWKSFVEATTPGQRPAAPDRKEMDKLNTPERMEKMLERFKEHQSRMEQHLAALKTFYAVLTPEQQKIFDDSHRHLQQHMLRQHFSHAHAVEK